MDGYLHPLININGHLPFLFVGNPFILLSPTVKNRYPMYMAPKKIGVLKLQLSDCFPISLEIH